MGPLATALKPLLFYDTAKTTSRAGFWYITEKSVGTELGEEEANGILLCFRRSRSFWWTLPNGGGNSHGK